MTGGGCCAHSRILGLLTFLLSQDLYFTVRDVNGGASESAAKLPLIIIFNLLLSFKKIVLSDLILQFYNRNKSCQKCHFKQQSFKNSILNFPFIKNMFF